LLLNEVLAEGASEKVDHTPSERVDHTLYWAKHQGDCGIVTAPLLADPIAQQQEWASCLDT